MHFACIFEVPMPILRLFCDNYVSGYLYSIRSMEKQFEVFRETIRSHLKTFEIHTKPWAPGIEDKAHPSIRMGVVALQQSNAGSMHPMEDTWPLLGAKRPTCIRMVIACPIQMAVHAPAWHPRNPTRLCCPTLYATHAAPMRPHECPHPWIVLKGEVNAKEMTFGRHLTTHTSISKFH